MGKAQRTPAMNRTILIWRLRIAAVAAVFFIGVVIYAVFLNPASKPGASDAYKACTSAIVADVPAMIPDGPGDVSYAGADDLFTISGNYHLGDIKVAWVCHAVKLPSGISTATYELP